MELEGPLLTVARVKAEAVDRMTELDECIGSLGDFSTINIRSGNLT